MKSKIPSATISAIATRGEERNSRRRATAASCGRKRESEAAATGVAKMWPSPGGAGANPYGITITPDGMVWYSESGVTPNTVIRFNPKTEEFARAKIPSGGGTVRNMAATADGRIYLACSGVNKVGVVEPAR